MLSGNAKGKDSTLVGPFFVCTYYLRMSFHLYLQYVMVTSVDAIVLSIAHAAHFLVRAFGHECFINDTLNNNRMHDFTVLIVFFVLCASHKLPQLFELAEGVLTSEA